MLHVLMQWFVVLQGAFFDEFVKIVELVALLLHEMDGASGVAVESSFFQTLFNGLVKDGEILGSLRAGVHWTPTVFAIAQKESVDSFFSQNSFISYDLLHKLGILTHSRLQYLYLCYIICFCLRNNYVFKDASLVFI
ncbi:hypothetical protein LOK49_LG07G03046 [Camellia lanceoleosa]|uniref:Uncharacterized protein n=1 Tax=Camellia lanceoleosa TaxID=1840588 RepID=A0ACC0H6J7_9ERIC|nr:hypothetical protein LOK49_LG07G03046 [Camellia lanceoleosa]